MSSYEYDSRPIGNVVRYIPDGTDYEVIELTIQPILGKLYVLKNGYGTIFAYRDEIDEYPVVCSVCNESDMTGATFTTLKNANPPVCDDCA